MNWEETIINIRTKPEFKELVEKAYLEADLPLNVHRFRNGEEFRETLKTIQKFTERKAKLLDIGAGNGVSSVSFALEKFEVTAVEPDLSNTVGAGAIQLLKQHFGLKNLQIIKDFGENISLESNSFDIVYIRQAMHHANNLNKFVKEAFRILKPDGIFIAVRDHVIYNKDDKDLFLENHPLNKYYNGENAYTLPEYKKAIQNAGGKILKILKHYDSVINYFPLSEKEYTTICNERKKTIIRNTKNKIGSLSEIGIIQKLFTVYYNFRMGSLFDERKKIGRLYSFIALKKK